MPPPNPDPKKTTMQPCNQHIFDPWNTSSTGHQSAENPYSRTTEWRDTRREKLARQFRSNQPSARGDVGGTHTLGKEDEREGEERGEWKWMSAQEATRNDLGVTDIRRYMGVSKAQPQPQPSSKLESQSDQQRQPTLKEKLALEPAGPPTISPLHNIFKPTDEGARHADFSSEKERKGIFTSLTFYINGSTYPTISDHKLKRLLADEGGNISLYLARKSVTHVILGAAAAAAAGANGVGRKTGGLLSAGKMQKEVLSKTSGYGKGVKYVNVEWVIESIKAGKKLAEARFSPSSTVMSSSSSARGNGLDKYKTTATGGGGVGVPVGQKSVYDMFNKSSTTRDNEDIG
ncbi:hypothetical protein TCE0_017r04058 [Talaromyces pinophilus]|uniref:BRCT domain-containing protein n=1 Tax=Talaromyces pinophilus TaxID=128442 RepID=A0A6V8H3Y1_TALPI|nr:hypothetical protein TCE0_017r04058 [Talaromyces pinophilus]